MVLNVEQSPNRFSERTERVVRELLKLGHGDRLRHEGDCLVWVGAGDDRGFGRLRWGGEVRATAHVAWEIDRGEPFPKGRRMAWSCGNPACATPEHLSVATSRTVRLTSRTVPRTVAEAEAVLAHIDLELERMVRRRERIWHRRQWIEARLTLLRAREAAA